MTTGSANDRIVPWQRPWPVFLILLAGFSAAVWLLHSGGVDDLDGWAGAPTVSALVTISGLCGSAESGSKIRRPVLALVAAAATWLVVTFVAVRLFPAAGHEHPGPIRGAIYLISAIVTIAAFVATTRRPRRSKNAA